MLASLAGGADPDEPQSVTDARAALDLVPAAVALVDRSLRVVSANRGLADLATEGDDAPAGRLLSEVLPGARSVAAACEEVFASGQPVTGRLVPGGGGSRPGASSCWRLDVRPVDVVAERVRVVAVAVEDVTEHRRALDATASLQVLTEEMSGAASLEAVLRVALGRIGAAVGAGAASIGLVDRDSGLLHTISEGFPDEVKRTFAQIPLDAALPGPATVRDGRARYLVDRATTAVEFPEALGIVDGTPFEAAAVHPLLLADEPLGYLAVHFTARGELDTADRELLTAVARACAVAVERARRGDEERAERDLARRQQALAGALAVAGTADEVAAILAEQTPAVLGATVAMVSLYDPETRSFSLAEPTTGIPAGIRSRFPRWSVDAPLPSRDVFRTLEPVIFRSLAERDALYPALVGVEVAEQAWVQLPLHVQERFLGTVSFGWQQARDFAGTEVERMQSIAEVCSGALERARLSDEHRRIAQTLQRSLLPPRLPAPPGWRLAARYQPAGVAARAGGDWYDAFVLPGGRVGLLIGDVAGHGVTAAGLMGQVRALARAMARGGAAPGEVLTALNAAVHDLDSERADTFVTCCLLQIGPAGAPLTVASAGHLAPLVRPPAGGPVVALDLALGPPLGVQPGFGYATAEVPLPLDATVLLFTDGLVERHDRVLDDGLADLTGRLRAAPEEVDALCDALLAAALADGEPTDDIALLAVQAHHPA